MNVLSVHSNMGSVEGGGAAERTRQLCRALIARPGVSVDLLSLDLGSVSASDALPAAVRWTRLRTLWRRFQVPWPAWRAIDALVGRADVVHLEGHWTPLNPLVAWRARRRGRPYVLCAAGALRIVGRSRRLKKVYDRVVGRLLVRHAARLIAISSNEREALLEYGVEPRRIALLPNGIWPEAQADPVDAAELRERLGTGEAPFVLFVGRLDPIKGPDLLIEAFSRLAGSFPHHLVLAGPDAGMRRRLEEQVLGSGIAARVHFPGFLTGPEKSAAYAAAELLAIPSRQEAMSLVVLESGAAATPVVCTDRCGLEELGELGAAIVVPASAEGLEHGLRSALGDREGLRTMGERLRRLVLERFTWDRVGEEFAAILETARGVDAGAAARHGAEGSRGAQAAATPGAVLARWPWVRWLPGLAMLAYLAGTVLLFYFGPWRYPVLQHGKLAAFLAAAHMAFALGYLLGARSAPRASTWAVDPARIAVACIALDLALLLPASMFYTGSWIPPVADGLADAGAAHARALRRSVEGVPYINYLRMAVAPALAASLPLGIFFWARLPRLARAALVVLVAGTLALFVGMGTNKGVGEWAMVFPWLALAAYVSGTLRPSRRAVLATALIALASGLLFLSFFATTLHSRRGSGRLGRLPSIGAVFEPGSEGGDPTLPRGPIESPLTAGLAGLTSYLTQGYYAVHLALEEPFVPMWGVGHSLFLQRQLARLTGDPTIVKRSYPQRIAHRGWNAEGSWATLYSWVASDVGFPGTVLAVFLVGWLLARAWVDAIGAANPFAVAFLGQLLLLVYYIPAHGRTFQTGEGVFAFWSLLILWLLSRRERR